MSFNVQRKKLCRHLLVGGALFAAGFGMYSCSDTYDLGEKQPTGLNSIYGYMQEQQNFTNYLRLIDDLGQAEILSKTGSKTMFIADDEAFARFYKNNSWGVTKYEDLKPAQKKLLLNSAMIDNPYSSSMLSTAVATGDTGSPIKGEVCRRSSSLTLYDSVSVFSKEDLGGALPLNDRFSEVCHNHDSIVLFTDASNAAPMIHFTGKFVTSNKLETTDIDFIYNQQPGTFKTDDVYINNSKVIKSNIFCKNGFIHQVDNVIMPLDNMAEIIRKTPQLSKFSEILERFAAPDDSVRLTDAYNQNKGTSYDSVFVKRYFSDRSAGSTMNRSVPFMFDKNGAPFDASLKYDPGWNGYVPYINNVREPMMEDMAVMIVPSNKALDAWWDTGGEVIKNYYHSIPETPNSVLEKLINVNQLVSFVQSVPSKFGDVLNDANEQLGLKASEIDSVILGCNGIIYISNVVYAPTAYSSVLFPAVIDTTSFKIISNAIDNLNYDKYLNSMVSRYTLLLPTNKGLLSYVDPVSYGQTTSNLWEFHFDESKSKSQRIYAEVYKCRLNDDGTWEKDLTDGTKPITTITGGTGNSILKNRIEDMLDNIIVTERYTPGKKYYKTKGRTFVKIEGSGKNLDVSGSWQEERHQPMHGVHVYDSLKNGVSIELDGVVMGTRKSVAATLAEHEEFSEFLSIMQACGAVTPANSKDGWQGGDQVYGNLFNLKSKGSIGAEDATSSKGKATYLLNNFHYTVYAPTNDAMQKAYEAGLPTLDDLDRAEMLDDSLGYNAATDTASYAAKIMEVMLDFVKYHIQDNSIYVDEGFESADYESGKTELIKSTAVDEETGEETWNGKYSPGRPYKLKVNVSSNGMTVTDCRYGYDQHTHQPLGGNTANVIMKDGLYNLMAREYWFESSAKVTEKTTYSTRLNNSSAVVIHAIDAPLIYADGAHYDTKGLIAPTQFIYTYKPLSSE